MLQIGTIHLAAWHIILLSIAFVAVLWILLSFRIRVTGTWERVDEGATSSNKERISLVQFGPFIRGRRLMPGGFQEFSGILRGRGLYLVRRDHGVEMIIRQGFPKELAPIIDASVTARLRLTVSADGEVIFGTFTPQKIEFTHRPPTITRRRFLDPSFRRYRLVSRELLDMDESIVERKRNPLRTTV